MLAFCELIFHSADDGKLGINHFICKFFNCFRMHSLLFTENAIVALLLCLCSSTLKSISLSLKLQMRREEKTDDTYVIYLKCFRLFDVFFFLLSIFNFILFSLFSCFFSLSLSLVSFISFSVCTVADCGGSLPKKETL